MKVIAVLSALLLAVSASTLRSPAKAIKDLLPSSRIIGGSLAYPGEFPYIAHLTVYGNGKVWNCGASILTNEWLLTAAHCTYQASEIHILAGSTKLSPPESSAQIRTSSHYIIHHEYNSYTLKNDIALIRLSEPLEFNSDVNKVELISEEEAEADLEGKISVASGWGKTADNAGGSNELLFTYLYISSQEQCAQGYIAGLVTAGNICGTMSTCQGDSGGPLNLENGPQIGLTSFGPISGCTTGIPVAFTRISYFLEWIKFYTQL